MIDPLLAVLVGIMVLSLVVNWIAKRLRRRRWNPPSPSLRARLGARPLLNWFVMVAALFIAVWLVAPQNVPVILYKLELGTLGGLVGWALDFALFTGAQPKHFAPADQSDELWKFAWIRQAVLVGCMILGVTIGL